MIETSVLITLNTRAGARHPSSLTCSAATPRHRLVEGASGSCCAVWMRPSAAVSEGLVVLDAGDSALQGSAAEADLVAVGIAVRDLAHAVRVGVPRHGIESPLSDL